MVILFMTQTPATIGTFLQRHKLKIGLGTLVAIVVRGGRQGHSQFLPRMCAGRRINKSRIRRGGWRHYETVTKEQNSIYPGRTVDGDGYHRLPRLPVNACA